MKNFKVIITIFFIALTITGCNNINSENNDLRIPVSINAAKFEYTKEENNGFKIVTSEIETLTTFFNSVKLKKIENAFNEDWIYRITFTNAISSEDIKSKIKLPDNTDTIVILVGKSSLQINGETFVAAEGLNYSQIFDTISSKYKYFDYELYY